MKILVVTQYFYPETFRVNTLCTELVQRGHEVTVLTGYPQYPQGRIYDGYGFNTPYEKEWNGIKIERIKMRPRGKTPIGLFLNCFTFVQGGNKWVRKCIERFDAVYVFEVSPATVGLPAVKYKEKFGTPIYFNVQDLWPDNVEVILGIHNRIIIDIINKIMNRIYAASDAILCASNGFIENIRLRGVDSGKLVFWPQFCARPSESSARPEIFSDEDFCIVFAGNLGEAQGLDLLVDAAFLTKDAHIKWYLVGDGRAAERLKHSVREKDLIDSVIFTGRVSEAEANRYVYHADCAYLSFIDNAVFDMTIPAKLQTYLACGTPILAAVNGESEKIINEYECGLCVAKNAADIGNAAVRLSLLPEPEKTRLSKNASLCFDELFDMDKLISRFEDIIR